MTDREHTPDNAVAELIQNTRNLLAFHQRCGLDYPYNNALQSFLEASRPADPEVSRPEPQHNPAPAGRDGMTGSPVEAEKEKAGPDDLAAMIAECRACSLGGRTGDRIAAQGQAKPPGKLLIVCDPPRQAPGTVPIQGEARELLGRMLAAIDLTFQDVCLTSIIKCPPGKTALPAPEELKHCLTWFNREIDLFAPRLILTLGPLSAGLILDKKRQLFTMRGRLQKWRDIPLVPSYHPDMLLKHNELKKASWEDLKLVKKMLSG